MSIFSKLKDKIFGDDDFSDVRSGSSSTASAPARSGATSPVTTVDVEASLERKAAASGKKYNWRTSIVDLMTLVGMESSLDERRELARELGYTGSTDDTATMNIWLHKQVMRKLAENGGQVPASLLD